MPNPAVPEFWFHAQTGFVRGTRIIIVNFVTGFQRPLQAQFVPEIFFVKPRSIVDDLIRNIPPPRAGMLRSMEIDEARGNATALCRPRACGFCVVDAAGGDYNIR
jgi:hypothetical protein